MECYTVSNTPNDFSAKPNTILRFLMNTMVEWLEYELRERGWSNNELARRAGLSPAGVSAVMTGQSNPGAEFCLKVSGALNAAPTSVFRLAGLLPPAPEMDEIFEDIVFCYDRMTPEAREYFRVVARAFADGRFG
jgi:transcriptional regulator with XRE-family HTH domain